MSDREKVGVRVDANLWQQFRQNVEDRHGYTRGVLGKEVDAALRQYLNEGAHPELQRANAKLTRIENALGVADADGGTDTLGAQSHTHAPAAPTVTDKPAANTATDKKVEYLAHCVLEKEVQGEDELRSVPRSSLIEVVKEEYGFRSDTAKRYVERLVEYFDLLTHPHNSDLYVTEAEKRELLEQEVSE